MTIGIAALALYAVAIIFALVQIQRTDDLTPPERLVWTLAVVFAPVIGSLVWYALGPHPFGLRLSQGAR
ncbi:hypothetical protein D6T64_05515 [Cryobacterium melibiosiphilum]|uniref:Cardiolipin synthase N-terminal domain-containing protein n=1 Tax=Cryobacterium melibiosiphilum TaxID=995039 RepID=A0A3A5ML91_9MICO|nr:PLDc N-terminal domain-containing protein [Cryobacterium melibiosiphilum]RJT89795.1 hypothetical protein D6T64_05515 [Cryobacterium melibiosiphilum]